MRKPLFWIGPHFEKARDASTFQACRPAHELSRRLKDYPVDFLTCPSELTSRSVSVTLGRMPETLEGPEVPEKELWVPIGEAAAMLDVSERTIRRWHSRGKLSARKRGGQLQYQVSSVDEDANDAADAISATSELLAAVKDRERELFGVMIAAIQKTTEHVLQENTQLRAHVQGVEEDLRKTSKLIEEAHSAVIEREAEAAAVERGEARKDMVLSWLSEMAQRAMSDNPKTLDGIKAAIGGAAEAATETSTHSPTDITESAQE